MQKSLKLGVLGENLSHSKSPQIQSAGLQYLGLDGTYEKFEILEDNFRQEITKLLSEVNGLNVTIPYKEKIIKYLNRRDSLVERIGAANTLVIQDGQITGYNTDYYGFKESLKEHDLKGASVSIIGAGGASKAIITALDDMGVAEVNICARNPGKVEDNLPSVHKAQMNLNLYSEEYDLSGSKLIINCTPIGQGRLASSMPLTEAQIDGLKAGTIIYDLVYSETTLLKEAKARGLITIDGSQMLILQGVKSLSIWTGREIDAGLIKSMTDAFRYQEESVTT